jgi:hypothetical protein
VLLTHGETPWISLDDFCPVMSHGELHVGRPDLAG